MTKKDYVKLAEVVSEQALTPMQHVNLVNGLVRVLQADNSRFDELRFRHACLQEDTDGNYKILQRRLRLS